MILADWQIKMLAKEGMIYPFKSKLIRQIEKTAYIDRTTQEIIGAQSQKVLSYGLGSFGYDLRLSPKEFFVFRHIPGTVVNPKNFNPANLEKIELQSDGWGDYFVVPAHSYGLGVAVEKLEIPDNVTVVFIGKSTYARCGLIANVTPGEAGWKGYLTLEFSNSSSADTRIYANEGCVQALFFQGEWCGVSYGDRSGKYQDQSEEVTIARI